MNVHQVAKRRTCVLQLIIVNKNKMIRKECYPIGDNILGETTKDGSPFFKVCKCNYQCSHRNGKTGPSHEITVEGKRACYWYKTEVFNDYECIYYLFDCVVRKERGKAGPRYAQTWCCEECNYALGTACGDPEYYYISSTLSPCDEGNDCDKPGKG